MSRGVERHAPSKSPGVSSTGEWRNQRRAGMGESVMAWATPEYGGRVKGVEVILQTKTALRGKGGGRKQT